MIPFAIYTTAETPNTFQRHGQPQKLPHPSGDLDPLGPHNILIGSAILQGSQMWSTDRQTRRHVYRPHYSICSNTPHLAIAVMQPKHSESS